MDKDEIRKQARFYYEDELQYAIARDEQVDLTACRGKAALRVARKFEGQDLSALWLGYIEGIARQVERGFEEDLTTGQLRVDGALRTGDLTFVPTPRMREHDWLSVDDRHGLKVREHVAKYDREHAAIMGIVERLRAHGGDPTTIEACPDLFADRGEAAA